MTPEPGADDRFVTVSQAVSLLEVSERTARRYAGQVPDSDRQTPDKGPARYRLSSLRRIARSGEVPDTLPDSDRPKVAPTPDNAGHVPDSNGALAEAMQRAAVAEARADLLESERDNLRDALKREQETARRAMDAQNALAAELAKAREQSAVLIAATATGRIAPFSAPSGTEDAGRGQGDTVTPPGPSQGENEVIGDGGEANGNRQETGKNPASDYSAQNNPARPWWVPKWLFGDRKEEG